MNRIATYKFSDLNDTGIDKMPVGAQGVVNKFGNLTRFVKGVEDASLTPSTTVGDYLTNNLGDYYEDVLYPSNNYVQGPADKINATESSSSTATSNQTVIAQEYSTNYPIAVYINNSRLEAIEYTATSGTDIVLNQSLNDGDTILVIYTPVIYGTEQWATKNKPILSQSIDIIHTLYNMKISPDGTVLFGFGAEAVYQYNFGIPWDISTLTLTNSHAVADARGGYLNEAGTQIMISLINQPDNRIYSLGTPWDLSTIGTEIGNIITEKASSYYASLMIIDYYPNKGKLYVSLVMNKDGSTSTYGRWQGLASITGDDLTTIDLSTVNDEIEMVIVTGFEEPSANHGGCYLTPDGTHITTGSTAKWGEWILTTPFDFTTRTLITSDLAGMIPIYAKKFKPDGYTFIGSNGSIISEYS